MIVNYQMIVATVLALALSAPAHAARSVPAPRLDAAAGPGIQTAVLAGGCFWGLEAVFERVKGVHDVTSGYAGGRRADANYKQVSSDRTGHAEAVQIRFDGAKISYGTLLHIYFSVTTDPTQLNRQGPDVGRSYRSAIFPQNEAQAKIARAYIAQLSRARAYAKPIVTTIEKGPFFAAEPFHQDFMRKNPRHPYIVAHDVPKVEALKRLFPARYRA
jgi:peptide-methionine (S)-S-oxide reductase